MVIYLSNGCTITTSVLSSILSYSYTFRGVAIEVNYDEFPNFFFQKVLKDYGEMLKHYMRCLREGLGIILCISFRDENSRKRLRYFR